MALSASLSACAGIPKITPHVIDTQLNECREYKVVDYENVKIKFVKSHPIDKCNGYYSLPPKEAAELKAWYLKNKKSSNTDY